MPLHTLIKAKLRSLPDKPGCYLMRDAAGKIIYVGKASSLRKRVQSYFHAAARRGSSAKLRSLVHSVRDLDVIVARNEANAILTENKLIKDYQPRFNVLLRDDKRFPLLSIDLRQKWPRFRLGRIRRHDGALYFGPYLSSAAARTALEFIETKFGLRKCVVSDPDAETHRHCLNDVIRFCSAPCIGKISPEEYQSNVAEALAFLRGERPQLLKELQNAMEQAAAGLDFEKAAVIRDTLQMLYSALKLRGRIARPAGVSKQSATAGLDALRKTLGLRQRPELIQAVDISNISGKHAVGSMVAAVAGICRPALYRRFRITFTEETDDATMMSEVIFRHFKRLREEQKKMPDLLLIDGGIVQVRAAQRILRKLGVSGVAVAGLAKRFERIFLDREGGAQAISLSPDSPALQILQRLRDEAHRFALSYHRLLRAKVIRESVLDDIAGVGQTRKQQLLKHFGSLRGLTRASEKSIASLAGIGPALAHRIKLFIASGR